MSTPYESAKNEAIHAVLNTSRDVQYAVRRSGYRFGVDVKHLDRMEKEVREATSFECDIAYAVEEVKT